MKSARQEKLLELIDEQEIETQEELMDALNALGFSVTQATVSRDIRQLGLIKIPGQVKKHRYASGMNASRSAETIDLSEKYLRVFREGFLYADTAQNILVIKTVSGMAMAVAAAVDAMRVSEIVGSIAGDDTIMCAVRTQAAAVKLQEQLNALAK